jgi:hypothetical protein
MSRRGAAFYLGSSNVSENCAANASAVAMSLNTSE